MPLVGVSVVQPTPAKWVMLTGDGGTKVKAKSPDISLSELFSKNNRPACCSWTLPGSQVNLEIRSSDLETLIPNSSCGAVALSCFLVVELTLCPWSKSLSLGGV